MTPAGWVYVGQVGVDSGMVMVGDPCYQFPGQHLGPLTMEKLLAGDPVDVVDGRLVDAEEAPYGQVVRVGQELVAVRSGFGDGLYEVFVRVDKRSGRIAELRVRFM